MSWIGVKHNPRKSNMHYLLPAELRKKKEHEEGVGSSSSPARKKKNVSMLMESEDEEDTQPLERKKRIFPMFPQLSEQAVLSGKDVNEILNVSFIGDPLVKKLGTGFSLVKIMNPQPISSTIPHTRAAQNIIDIQDDLGHDTTSSTTIITEQPPSSPQPQYPPQ